MKNAIKFDKFDSKETRLYKTAQIVIQMAEQTIGLAEAYELTNSQQFLDFLDKLNELSVKY